jgi:hypothetical protein
MDYNLNILISLFDCIHCFYKISYVWFNWLIQDALLQFLGIFTEFVFVG